MLAGVVYAAPVAIKLVADGIRAVSPNTIEAAEMAPAAGAGALGFDVVSGFRQSTGVGRGFAAGTTIVLIGIMLDRLTTHGARRASDPASRA